METKNRPAEKTNKKHLVSLPMRDGNAYNDDLCWTRSNVVSLPMRDGNEEYDVWEAIKEVRC